VRHAAHAFVAPDLGGRPTGGTLYNAALIEALRAQNVPCEHYTLADAALIARSPAEHVWVDSLYLDALPGLCARLGLRRSFLVLHYLPALVAHGRPVEWAELSDSERAALSAADGFLVTGAFMREQVARFELGRPVLCVEPGVERAVARARERTTGVGDSIAAIMVCNVVEGKGVLPLLAALAHAARASDQFTLEIVGALDVEPEYAAACRRAIDSAESLRERVALNGTLPHAEALARLGRSDVLVSASRMEAFGMALGEARAAGIPIVARRGGNVSALVSEDAGGALSVDEAGVAAGLLELARDRARLEARKRAALAAAPSHARSWRDAALDLVAQTQRSIAAS
jgi:glycosyltransferase involved in cell wall biosynthesis